MIKSNIVDYEDNSYYSQNGFEGTLIKLPYFERYLPYIFPETPGDYFLKLP